MDRKEVIEMFEQLLEEYTTYELNNLMFEAWEKREDIRKQWAEKEKK